MTVNVPSLDFGLMRLGDQTTATLVLTNTAHLEASWTLEEVHKSHRDRQVRRAELTFILNLCSQLEDLSVCPQIRMKPTSGVLPPLANCSVDVLFTPHFCQKLETELELTVKNGTGWSGYRRLRSSSPSLEAERSSGEVPFRCVVFLQSPVGTR